MSTEAETRWKNGDLISDRWEVFQVLAGGMGAVYINDSKWELIDQKRFMLHSDGSISSEFDDRKGSWEVVASNTIKISVPWQPAPPRIITTNRDATILRWTEDETNLAMREGT